MEVRQAVEKGAYMWVVLDGHSFGTSAVNFWVFQDIFVESLLNCTS